MSYREYWDEIFKQSNDMNSLITSYWHDYSNMGTWQFWVVISLLVLPLVLLYFTVDRRRVFELFFFGYTVHLLWAYTDLALQRYSIFVHTYFLSPIFPNALNMTASALPVGYLLLYQYCLNHKKNFLVYTFFLSAVFAFGFATIEAFIGMVEFNKGMNQLYLFLIDIVITYIAYFFTKFVKKMSSKEQLNS
ncbi:hypothetical protein J7I93_01500 [Bacillus sp. ISL-47]|uniref:hypothetical protein n=1 Tax=Bacillus sp. ISL-47 TaxID=2819130 RepID=UPI001BE817B9|nr:hypothetical protein [Bacillus sp. ISL-47]MBT2686850.1 hypothetical protein [Bacillus sp. ISL-47]MBT2706796.1 hypothetical protein [Pseudomonas sp. ISL-84]